MVGRKVRGGETDQQSKLREGAEPGARSGKAETVTVLGALTPSLSSEELATETVLSLGVGSMRTLWRSKGCEQGRGAASVCG